jgi:chitin synthase
MYLFLVIYSIFNLHVVSWGTREVAVKKSAAELEEEAKEAEEEAKQAELKQRKQTGTIWGRITGGTSKLGFFARTEEGLRGDLDKINSKLDGIERALKKEGYKVQEPPKKEETRAPKIKFPAPSTGQKETRSHIKRDEMVNPFWMEQSNQVKNGPIHKLSKEETTFWWDMIDIYLKPLEKNVKKEKQQAAGLIDLRNQMAFGMVMINGLWIVALFLMQLQKDSLSIPWPLPGDQPDLALEPLGLVFLVFFAVVLVLQLIGNLNTTSTTFLKFIKVFIPLYHRMLFIFS